MPNVEKLPKALEQRWEKLKSEIAPLEISESNKIVNLWKLDNKSIFSILVLLFGSLVLAFVWFSASQWKPQSSVATNEIAIEQLGEAPKVYLPAANIFVHIFGEVTNPGVYELPNGSRVFQAIEAAGGQSTNRELSINLAEVLFDGDQIYIGEESIHQSNTAPTKSVTDKKNKPNCINLNTASEAELDLLPGIGPVMSQKIIQWRDDNGRFSAISELKKVKGIGDSKFGEIEPLVCI